MRYFLHKHEILRGHFQFTRIFKTGLVLRASNLRMIYNLQDEVSDYPIKIGFAISKNVKKKVHRNRIRRLLKEYYRLNKFDFLLKLKNKNKSIKLLVLFSNNDERISERIKYKILSTEFKKLLEEIIFKIKK